MEMEFESPIESRFADALLPKLGAGVEVAAQRTVVAAGGRRYRPDFTLAARGVSVVVECDGRQWHDFWQDRERDADILGGTNVSGVLHLRGCDILQAPDECVRMLGVVAPFLFGERGPLDLADLMLAGPSFRAGPAEPIYRCRVPVGEVGRHMGSIRAADFCKPFGVAAGGREVLLQFKSPTWGWAQKNPGAWGMADILASMMG